jgi:hypothetical protein
LKGGDDHQKGKSDVRMRKYFCLCSFFLYLTTFCKTTQKKNVFFDGAEKKKKEREIEEGFFFFLWLDVVIYRKQNRNIFLPINKTKKNRVF